MFKHLRTARPVFAFVAFVLLACSPGLVLHGLVGGVPTTNAPTQAIAQAIASITTTPVLRTASAVSQAPTLAAAVPGLAAQTVIAVPSSTAAPVLPLRTDLPALALRDWPRPANDNGFCIHFIPTGTYTAHDFQVQIPRLQGLQIRWVLALYDDENQLRLAATQFKAAGIVPIWRKILSPFQAPNYPWSRDVQILKDIGLPPYFQLYNEPDNAQEWGSLRIDRTLWIANFMREAKDLYNAGGYVGVQVIDANWLRDLLEAIKAQKGERLFGRMFFVPHLYGLNHPPNYVADGAGVLGYRTYVSVFQQEIGFVPPLMAGEGGWKFAANDDNRFPPIDDRLHAQYHVELFNWFRLGKVSDGQPLPDYMFAFCPWILSAPMEGAAWYDSFEGNRELTIADMKKIPVFTRQFSWDQK